MAAAAAKKGAAKKQAAPASKHQSPPKKEPERSITGNKNSAAVALRNRSRGYAPGFEGMTSLYLAHNPEQTMGTMRIPAVIGWYTRIASGEQETTRQTSAARRHRPTRQTTTDQTGEQGEAEQPAQPEKLKTATAGR